MNVYFQDITKSGKVIYYKLNRHRFVRASSKQVELEVSMMQAKVFDYVPNKPKCEMTDRQLLADCRNSIEFSGKLFSTHTDELEKRGLSIN